MTYPTGDEQILQCNQRCLLVNDQSDLKPCGDMPMAPEPVAPHFSVGVQPRMMPLHYFRCPHPLMKSRLTREKALSFLLSYLVVDRQKSFTMDQMTLFNLSNLAAEAENRLSEEEGLIPHEVIESLADQFLESL